MKTYILLIMALSMAFLIGYGIALHTTQLRGRYECIGQLHDCCFQATNYTAWKDNYLATHTVIDYSSSG